MFKWLSNLVGNTFNVLPVLYGAVNFRLNSIFFFSCCCNIALNDTEDPHRLTQIVLQMQKAIEYKQKSGVKSSTSTLNPHQHLHLLFSFSRLTTGHCVSHSTIGSNQSHSRVCRATDNSHHIAAGHSTSEFSCCECVQRMKNLNWPQLWRHRHASVRISYVHITWFNRPLTLSIHVTIHHILLWKHKFGQFKVYMQVNEQQ